MVIDLGTDGEDRILQVRWADGSVDSVRPDELRLQEAVTMSNARKLIEAVVQGHNPRAVVGSPQGLIEAKNANLDLIIGGVLTLKTNLAKGVKDLTHWISMAEREASREHHFNNPQANRMASGLISALTRGEHEASVLLTTLSVIQGAVGDLDRVMAGEPLGEDIGPDPVPTGPMVGTHPAADVPPMPEDPCFMYRTSFDSGGGGPHAHIAMLDDTGNGTTDEEMGSQHSVLRFEVQPDPKDGHVHTLDQGTRRDVPSSQNGEGFSFHLLQADPNRFSY